MNKLEKLIIFFLVALEQSLRGFLFFTSPARSEVAGIFYPKLLNLLPSAASHENS
jgi:hypothetical protein